MMPLQLTGTELAADLRQLMLARPLFSGRVHSVFDRSVNVLTGQDELVTVTVAPRGVMPTGFSVNLDHTGPLGLSPGSELVFERLSVRLPGGRRISLKEARVRPVFVERDQFRNFSPDPAVLDDLKAILLAADSPGIAPLAAWIPGEEDLPRNPGNHYCAFIARDLRNFTHALVRGEEEGLSALSARLIGFGPGLTPSLDDFLSAVALVLFARDRGEAFLKNLGALARNRTTLVSCHMLKNAAAGKAQGLYRRLLEKLRDGDPGAFRQAAGEVLDYGASSGADFLYGFYCALYAWIKQDAVRVNPDRLMEEKAFASKE